MKFCQNCGSKVEENVKFCPYCGTKIDYPSAQTGTNPEPAVGSAYSSNTQNTQNTQAPHQTTGAPSSSYGTPVSPSTTVFDGEKKERIAAALLAIFLGGFGVHKFYLGNITMGIIYLVLSFTGITWLIGLVEGIIYLTKTDEEFYRDHVLPIEERKAEITV